MSIRGILCTPAGILERVDKLEHQLLSKIETLQVKVDTHQLWSRPLVISLVSGVVVAVLLTFVKPAIEHYIGTNRAVNTPATQSPVVDGIKAK
jgi:capsular polysaccharide biosynthesis protein